MDAGKQRPMTSYRSTTQTPVLPGDADRIQQVLDEAVEQARANDQGAPASYAPELASAPVEKTAAAITLPDGTCLATGDTDYRFTLQSSAKLITLIALLEELGPEQVFSVVGRELSDDSYASLAHLETHGPVPANPLINAGAIALCSQVHGPIDHRLTWLRQWTERLYGEPLDIDPDILKAERRHGDHNRAIAYLMRQFDVFDDDVDEVLETYFALCSLEADVRQAPRLPALLARGGCDAQGKRILSPRTVHCVVALMTTAGMYDASGSHLVATGIPAKSGVSGVIVGVALGTAGIAVVSPRIDAKGASVRGQFILQHLADNLHWQFTHLLTASQCSSPHST